MGHPCHSKGIPRRSRKVLMARQEKAQEQMSALMGMTPVNISEEDLRWAEEEFQKIESMTDAELHDYYTSDPDGISEDRFRRQERFLGSWQRALSIPERVHEDQLTAEFNNGILKIHLPKADELKPRQIPVAEGSE